MSMKSIFFRDKPEYCLQDAVQTNQEYPRTFLIPTKLHLADLKIGDRVKLIFVMDKAADDGCRAERMWVELKFKQGNDCVGILNSQPSYLKTVRAGDEVKFCLSHIAEIGVKDIGFDENKMAILTKRAFEERQINWVVRSEELFDETDSGWQLFYGDEDQTYLDDPSHSMIVELNDVLKFEPLLEEVFKGSGMSFEYDTNKNFFVQPK